ncbi:MAG: molybdopterin-dependent oxidoreductase [Myxococcales bacterium]
MAEERFDILPPLQANDRRVLSREPPNAEAAEGAFGHLVTPAKMRFVRCHFDIPRLDDGHEIELSGAFVHPLRLSLAELRAMPPSMSTVVTECAGNGRATLSPPIVDGEPWQDRAVSAAQWTGVALPAILERSGLSETAVELVFTGADGGEYQRSLPREVALDPSTMVALEMNGAPIPPQFGGPVRLIVPGWYGMASVKWLARIEAVERPFSGRFQSEKYVYARGAPVTTIRIKSMFTGLPRAVRAGSVVRLTGLAWGADGVDQVEVAIDGEWRPARLVGPILRHAWRRFEAQWTPATAGRYLIACRATDARGAAQPDEPSWNEGGYGANGIQEVAITAV